MNSNHSKPKAVNNVVTSLYLQWVWNGINPCRIQGNAIYELSLPRVFFYCVLHLITDFIFAFFELIKKNNFA